MNQRNRITGNTATTTPADECLRQSRSTSTTPSTARQLVAVGIRRPGNGPLIIKAV
ncbi:hypothetical protein [Streptomyces albidoflavus]|uniref:hypothetical protein n=1 Tax=Streptomyces albidoflavus TaxID=1886 RepID=UPI002253B62F|nr:hypothetical protein [Streptomyces albidoflavus]MCX4444736.1 hypothetical protein [Streptomyces albidoflavus]